MYEAAPAPPAAAPPMQEAAPPPPPMHEAAPPPPPVHEAELMAPEVVPSEAAPAPPSPEEMAAAQEHANQMAAPADVMNDDEVQQFQDEAQMLYDKGANLQGKFGDAFKGVLDRLNVGNLFGGNGKVEAAKPCPFFQEGQQVTVHADAEIAQGSFVSFVSGLSVVSVEAQIVGTQAVAALPAGVAGQVYTFITSRSIDDNKLAADAISFGPAIVEGEFRPSLRTFEFLANMMTVQPPAPVIDFGLARK